MRTRLLLIVMLVLASCGNKKSTPDTKDTSKKDTTGVQDASMDQTMCFELKESFTDQKVKMDMNTVIQLTIKGDQVSGSISEERLQDGANVDAASGDIAGTKKGDTLFVDYTFTIEGYTQTDETVYVIQGDKLLEKVGEMIEKGDKFVYKDPTKAVFSKTYTKTTCK